MSEEIIIHNGEVYDGIERIAEDRPGYLVTRYVNRRPNGSISSYITSYRPILTEEERERRMKLIAEAAANLLLNLYETEARMAAQKEKESTQ